MSNFVGRKRKEMDGKKMEKTVKKEMLISVLITLKRFRLTFHNFIWKQAFAELYNSHGANTKKVNLYFQSVFNSVFHTFRAVKWVKVINFAYYSHHVNNHANCLSAIIFKC